MDAVFTQEELFWLDDILPGTKIGRIRRLSATRNVHIPKSNDDDNEAPETVNKFLFEIFLFLNKNFQPPIDRLDNNRDISGNLRSIAEVGWYIKMHEMI
jgi:hypothetical protein